jgi:aryl-alcohol dehydrogenase-like predicted oxidoreductase
VQSAYSLFSRDLEHSVLPALRELGVGLAAGVVGDRYADLRTVNR